MFYYFFLQYKKNIYKSPKRKILVKALIAFSLLILAIAVVAICIFLQKYNLVFGCAIVVMILDCIYMVVYTAKVEKDDLENKAALYRENKIYPLIQLLQAQTYNLYSKEGIDWLLNCCKEETPKSFRFVSLQSIVFPFITLAFGVIINKASLSEVISITISLIGLLLLVVIEGKAIQPILDVIIYPDKIKYACLQKQLEYIRTQIEIAEDDDFVDLTLRSV